MSNDLTISKDLDGHLSKFTKFRIREWIDIQDNFYLMLVQPVNVADAAKSYDYDNVLYKDRYLSSAEVLEILNLVINQDYSELKKVSGMHLDENSRYISIDDLNEYKKKFRELQVLCHLFRR
jgi:hypothetical protein